MAGLAVTSWIDHDMDWTAPELWKFRYADALTKAVLEREHGCVFCDDSDGPKMTFGYPGPQYVGNATPWLSGRELSYDLLCEIHLRVLALIPLYVNHNTLSSYLSSTVVTARHKIYSSGDYWLPGQCNHNPLRVPSWTIEELMSVAGIDEWIEPEWWWTINSDRLQKWAIQMYKCLNLMRWSIQRMGSACFNQGLYYEWDGSHSRPLTARASCSAGGVMSWGDMLTEFIGKDWTITTEDLGVTYYAYWRATSSYQYEPGPPVYEYSTISAYTPVHRIIYPDILCTPEYWTLSTGDALGGYFTEGKYKKVTNLSEGMNTLSDLFYVVDKATFANISQNASASNMGLPTSYYDGGDFILYKLDNAFYFKDW